MSSRGGQRWSSDTVHRAFYQQYDGSPGDYTSGQTSARDYHGAIDKSDASCAGKTLAQDVS